MRVRLTESANADLLAIGEFIAHDNPRRALTFVRELRGKCRDLGTLPHGWPPLVGFEALGLRKRVYGQYLIVFSTTGVNVEVVGVFHGARNYQVSLAARVGSFPRS